MHYQPTHPNRQTQSDPNPYYLARLYHNCNVVQTNTCTTSITPRRDIAQHEASSHTTRHDTTRHGNPKRRPPASGNHRAALAARPGYGSGLPPQIKTLPATGSSRPCADGGRPFARKTELSPEHVKKRQADGTSIRRTAAAPLCRGGGGRGAEGGAVACEAQCWGFRGQNSTGGAARVLQRL